MVALRLDFGYEFGLDFGYCLYACGHSQPASLVCSLGMLTANMTGLSPSVYNLMYIINVLCNVVYTYVASRCCFQGNLGIIQ